MWPKISYDKLLLPRSEGGLAILHPPAQQLALQLRWLQPLFDPEHYQRSFIHSWIIHCLHSWSSPRDPLICLLFQRLRPPIYQAPVSFTRVLCQTLDCFTLQLDDAILASKTVLQMHVLDTLQPFVRPVPSNIHKLWKSLNQHPIIIMDLFEEDAVQGWLRLKHPRPISQFPGIIRRLQTLLDQHILQYCSFACRVCVPATFLSGSPPLSTLDHSILPLVTLLKLEDIDFLNIKRKHFQQSSSLKSHSTSHHRIAH
ncbi:hypothetical protein K492DRAFT_200031 [Lichtheimia hyalospora FSU 10163]|nr:hypothetical protein K492DRAFT_200031 [Lichtheimia hyalospora FSU 10163]